MQTKNINKISIQTISNLCLKINVKLGGINSIIVPEMKYVLFIPFSVLLYVEYRVVQCWGGVGAYKLYAYKEILYY